MNAKLEFTCNKAEASESGGECFQVVFESCRKPKQYFLVQRMFEFEDEFDEPASCYIESHIRDYSGHCDQVDWDLTEKEFTCCYQLNKPVEVNICLDDPKADINEIRKRLKTIFSGLKKK